MRGVEVTKKLSVRVTLTADDWELFTFDDELRPRCEVAAALINQEIEAAVNEGGTIRDVNRRAMAVMQKYADLGAVDSEPLRTLDDVIEAIFFS